MKVSAVVAAAVGCVLAQYTAEQHDTARAQLIDEINSVPDILWKAGVNSRFEGTSVHSHSTLCGVKEDSLGDAHLLDVVDDSALDDNLEIPENFDSEQNWPECAKVIGDIRDQSNCGCCWAFAGAEAASDRLCIATKGSVAVPLSAQETCFCASWNGCGGGQVARPWQYLKESGLTTGGQYDGYGPLGGGFCSSFSLPHCHHHGPQGKDPFPAEGKPGCPSESSPKCPKKCDNDASESHSNFATDRFSFKGRVQRYGSVKAIQQTIMEHGPVSAAFTVYTDFANYVSGIYHHVHGGMEGGHAIRIVGWGVENGVEYWKVANSWNPWWGEKGYFRIKRGNNECGIEGQVVASGADASWGSFSEDAKLIGEVKSTYA